MLHPIELQAAAAELVHRTTEAQGLPEKISDSDTLRKIATIVMGVGNAA